MLDSLVKKECTLDSLNVNSLAEGTYNGTFTTVRSFNRFWNTHEFDEQVDTQLFALRYSYTNSDGFEALCCMFHNERNVLLSHYVVKLVPKHQNKEPSKNWSNDVEYKQLNAALDRCISSLVFENNEDHSSEIMSLHQFRVLKAHTWELALTCPYLFLFACYINRDTSCKVF